MVQPTYVGAVPNRSTTTFTTASYDAAVSAATASGDYVLLLVNWVTASTTSNITLNTPAGFTKLDSVESLGSGNAAAVFGGFVTGNAAVNITANGSGTSAAVVSIDAITVRGVDASTPVSVVGADVYSGSTSGSTTIIPALTTPSIDNLVVWFHSLVAAGTGTSATWSGAATATEQADGVSSGTSGPRYAHTTWAGNWQAAAGTTGGATVALSTARTRRYGIGLALQAPQPITFKSGSDASSVAAQEDSCVKPQASDTGSVGSVGSSGTINDSNVINNSSVIGATGEGISGEEARVRPNASDTGTATETATKIILGPAPGNDAASGNDNAVKITTHCSDNGSSTDTAYVALAVQGSDTGSSADTGAVRAYPAASELAAAADTAAVRATTAGSDSITVVDESAFVTSLRVVDDSASFVDGPARIANQVSDSVSTTESSAVVFSASDSISVVDESAFVTSLRDVDDAGSSIDYGQRVRTYAAETVSGIDSASLNAQAPVDDSVTATDTARVIILAGPDVGNAIDSLSRISLYPSDFGTSVDVGSIRVRVFGSDQGSGLDSARIKLTALPDTGRVVLENSLRSISGVLVAPRLTNVQAEDRRYVVDAESRTLSVDYELRITRIDYETSGDGYIDSVADKFDLAREFPEMPAPAKNTVSELSIIGPGLILQ